VNYFNCAAIEIILLTYLLTYFTYSLSHLVDSKGRLKMREWKTWQQILGRIQDSKITLVAPDTDGTTSLHLGEPCSTLNSSLNLVKQILLTKWSRPFMISLGVIL